MSEELPTEEFGVRLGEVDDDDTPVLWKVCPTYVRSE